jgi:hypothetical protein
MAALLVSFTVDTSAQKVLSDAREVVEAAYERTGGDKWKSIESMVTNSTITIASPQGEMGGTFKMSNRYPGYVHVRVLLDMDGPGGMPMGPMTQVVTPDTGYVKGDFGTQPLPKGTGPKAASEELALLSDGNAELTLVVEERDGRQVYAVSSMDGETKNTLYYDVETFKRLAKETDTPAGSATTQYDDYREVDGLMVPHSIVQEQSNGMKQVMKLKTVEFNVDVSGAFDVKEK